MEKPTEEALDRQKLLMLLITQHQRRIFSYIYTLVPSRHDADDLLQETSLVIVEKFHEFTPGTDFVAWACQIAWWRVRAARQKYARSKVIFDDDVLESVASTASTMHAEVSERHEALVLCLGKLPPRDREMVLARYERGAAVEDVAKHCGRTLEAAYKALGRLRKLLYDCVSNQLSTGGVTS